MNKFINPLFALSIFILSLTGCEYGYQFSQLVEDLAGKTPDKPRETDPDGPPGDHEDDDGVDPSTIALKETFANMQKCFTSYEDQYGVSEQLLDKLIKDNCFDKRTVKQLRRLREDISSSFTERNTNLSKINQDKLSAKEVNDASEKLATLSDHYVDMQNMFAYCRTKRFVMETPASEQITNEPEEKKGSLLLHAVGDVFALNSGYEGNESATALKHRLFYLRNIRKLLGDTTYIKDEAQSDPCKDIDLPFTKKPSPLPDFSISAIDIVIKKHEDAIKLGQAFQANKIQELRSELSQQLQGLIKRGDSVFLPASWVGHAFLYQFLLEEDTPQRKFSLRIYNSGQGIGAYHAQAIKGFEIQFLPFAEVTQLSSEQLTSYLFLKALTEIAIPETYNTKPEDFYEKVLFELGGKRSQNVYTDKDFKFPQQGGTCAYFSQPWVLESSFDNMQKNGIIEQESFFPARLESLFGLKTLYDFGQILREVSDDLSSQTEERLTLIEKSIVFLSSDLFNAAKDQVLDPGFLRLAAEVEEPLHEDVEKALTASEIPEANPFDASEVIEQDQEEKQTLAGELIDTGLIRDNPKDLGRKIYLLDKKGLILKENSKELLEQLGTLAPKLDRAREQGQFVQIIEYVHDLALQLPLDQAFFSDLKSADAEKAIASLSRIQSNYVFSLIKAIDNQSRPQKTISTADFIIVLKLLAVADLLNKNFVDENKRLGSLYQPRFGELLAKDLAIIETQASRMQKLLLDLRAYFKSDDEKKESFFNFERLPVGFSSENYPRGRRVMHDPLAKIPKDQRHWSDNKQWNDVDWAVKWIKNQDKYTEWLIREKQESAPTYSFRSGEAEKYIQGFQDTYLDQYTVNKQIQPFVFSFDPGEGHRGGDGGEYFYFSMGKEPISRIKPEIIERRKALSLLSQSKFDVDVNFSLPAVFFDMRQMSYEVDFLLTGPLTNDWASLATFKPVALDLGIQLIDHREATGEAKTFNSEKKALIEPGHYQNDEWIPTVYGYIPEVVEARYIIGTTFVGHSLQTRIFGQQIQSTVNGPYIKALKDIDGGRFISPYVHLQNGVLPFDKFAQTEKGVRLDINDLMRIYSTGIDKQDPKLDPLVAQERIRLLPNDLILLDPAEKDLKRLTLERIRGVFTLSGIKKFQLIETLAIFSKYPSLLTREEYQRLFEKLMLEPLLLLDQLSISEEESAQFVRKLTDFCKKQYQIFRRVDNVKGAAFILHMNQLFRLQVEYAIKHKDEFKVNEDLANEFLDSVEELRSLATDVELSKAQQGFLWVTLANAFSYVEDFSTKDMKNMLLAMSKYQTLSIHDKIWQNNYAEQQINNLLVEKQAHIQEALAGDDRNDILTFVAKGMKAGLKGEPDWIEKSGVLDEDERAAAFEAGFDDEVKIQFDVFSGLLYEAGQDQVVLPVSATELEKALGKIRIPPTVTRMGAESYKWDDDDGDEIRVDKSTGATRIQKKFDNDWYEYIDDYELLGLLEYRGFKKGYNHWKQIDLLVGQDQKVILIDKATKEKHYEVTISRSLEGNTVEEIIRVSDRLRLAQLPNDHKLVTRFSAIEDHRYIEFWIDNNNEVMEVSLPRLKLKFARIEGDTQLDCGHFIKHRLADLQFTQTLKGPKNYLVCEPRRNETAPRIALTALQQFEGSAGLPSLSINFLVNRDLTNGEEGSQRLLAYELPSLNETRTLETSRTITPLSNAAKMHLALRKWWTHDYQTTRSLLMSSDASLKPLSKSLGELKIIEWLIEGRPDIGTGDNKKEIQDVDPRATATRLVALAILIAQHEDYVLVPDLGSDVEKIEKFVKLYEAYLRNIDVVGNDWLSFYDEWTIASFIVKHNKASAVINNRIKVLKYLHPSRFHDESPVKRFRAELRDRPEKQLKKADHFRWEFQLKSIIQDAKTPGDPLGDVSALKAKNIFIPQNFGLFYNIAIGEDFDKNLAVEILDKLLARSADRDDLKIKELSKEDLRIEFLFIFRSSALYTKDETQDDHARMMARFLELASRANKPLPSWDTIKNAFAENARLEHEKEKLYLIGPWTSEIQDQLFRLMDQEYDFEKNLLTPIANADSDVCFAPHIEVEDSLAKEPLKSKKELVVKEEVDGLFQNLLLNDPMSGPYLGDDEFDNLFQTVTISEEETTELNLAKTSLNEKLDQGMNGPKNVKKALTELKDKITNYVDKQIETKKNYLVKNWDDLTETAKALEKKEEEALADKQFFHDEALRLVAGQKTLAEESVYTRILRLAQADRAPKIEDLIYLLLTKKLESLQKSTVEKKSKAILREIASNIVGYLLQSTYAQYLSELKKAVVDLYDKKGVEELAPYIRRVVSLSREQRHYKFADRIEYLIFEHFVGLHIRKAQVAALDKLEIKDGEITNGKALGPVLEMIMGFGKTSVLLPLISAMNTTGKWLNVIVLPEPLVASMSRELQRDITKSFNRSVKVININRLTKLNEESLILLYDRLVRARNEGNTIITTNSSIQSLFLSFTERLRRYQKDRNQIDNEVTQLIKIFQFLREFGLLTIDEVDLALDVLKAHQFSVGEKVPMNETLTASIFSFYRLLTEDEVINQEIALPFIGYSQGQALTHDSYQKIKSVIIDQIIDNPNFFRGFSALNRAYKKLHPYDEVKKLLRSYWNNVDAEQNRLNLFSAIDEKFDERSATVLKNAAAVLYEEINQVFFLTASKKLNIHYGKIPLPEKGPDETNKQFGDRLATYKKSQFIAIPYHAGQAAVNSRFGTPIEAVNYTMQRAIEERQFEEHVALEVESLKTMTIKATDEQKIKDVRNKFNQLIEGYPTPPRSVSGITEEDIKEIAKSLEREDRLPFGLDLIKSHTLPQLTTYETQLYTNAQIYESLFKVVSGFSGTLWSVETFPNIFKKPEGSDTTEKTYVLLWLDYLQRGKSAVRPIDEPDQAEADVYLQQLVNNIYQDGFIGSLLDEAGMFRGFNNSNIAEKIALKLPRDSGVINYDENNEIMVYERQTNSHKALALTTVPQNKRVAFWDKKHTTGSDLKLSPNMSARMTFDHHTFSRDLEQTVWRLRGLDQDQYIDEYLVLGDDLKLIKKKMTELLHIPEHDLGDFDLGELLLYVAVNQEVRLGELVHRSLKQKMNNAINLEVLNQIFAVNSSNERAAHIYDSFAKQFERQLSAEPYSYMGLPAKLEETSTVLASDRNRIFSDSIKKAIENVLSSGSEILSIIKDRIIGAINKVQNVLPEFLKSSETESGLEVEVEMEQEQEQELEPEAEREIERYDFERRYARHPVVLWPNKNAFEKAYYAPVNLDQIGSTLNNELESQNVSPLFQLKDGLLRNQQGNYQELATYINDNLYGSLNFAPLHHRNVDTTEDRYDFQFFSLFQKQITNVLVIIEALEEEGNANVIVVILDNNDVDQFDAILRNDLVNPTSTGKDYKIALYNLEEGIFRQGASRIDGDALENNESFIEMITQIKFLNGDLFYTEKQMRALEGFISSADKEYLFKLFKGEVLRYKQDSREQMLKSDIARAFENLGVY